MTIRIAAVQMCSVPDRAVNLNAAERLVEQAAAQGALFICLPENFSFVGSPDQKVGEAESADGGPTLEFLRQVGRRHEVFLIGGSIPIRTDDPNRVSNTCYAIDPNGNVLARYDKLHLFDVSIDETHTFRESDYIEPGANIITFEAAGLTLGLSICFDIRFPELYRRMAGAGADVVFVPSAFTVPTGRAHWEVLLRARAIENQCYVVAPAQIGEHTKGRTSYGKSMIVDPWGVVAALAADEPGIICADIDTGRIADVRNRLPALERRRRDLFPSQ